MQQPKIVRGHESLKLNYEKVPKWFVLLMNTQLPICMLQKVNGYSGRGNRKTICQNEAVGFILRYLSNLPEGNAIWDHWGTDKHDNLVMEPYMLDDKEESGLCKAAFQQIKWINLVFGTSYETDRTVYWAPEQNCVRITFYNPFATTQFRKYVTRIDGSSLPVEERNPLIRMWNDIRVLEGLLEGRG